MEFKHKLFGVVIVFLAYVHATCGSAAVGISEGVRTETVLEVFPAHVYRCCTSFWASAGCMASISNAIYPNTRSEIWQGGTVTTFMDVMFVTGQCKYVAGFNGTVVYVDGEAGQLMIPNYPRIVYLGLPHPPRPVAAVVPMVSIAHIILMHDRVGDIFHHKNRSAAAKNGFLVYANSHCVPFREKAFDSLVVLASNHNFIRPVSLGKCHGMHEETKLAGHSDRGNNAEHMSRYKFALVMENANVNGYVTEKIANAFMGDTIPIYYGTNFIFKLFHEDSFVFYNITNPQPALDRIAYLESNRSAYNDMLRRPILANGKKTLEEYFSLSDNVGGGKLAQRIRNTVLAISMNNTNTTIINNNNSNIPNH